MKQIGAYSAFILLCIGVFFFALWIQVLLFVLSVFLLEKKYLLIIPAMIADILYMPEGATFIPKTLFFTIGILVLVAYINKKTRIRI